MAGRAQAQLGVLSGTASVLKGTDGILPAILNTLYVILLTLLIVLPLGVGAAVYLTEYATNRRLIALIEFYQRDPGRASPASCMAWWVCWCSTRHWACAPVCCPAA